MNIEDYYNYCLSLKGSEEHMPFDKKTLVFKVKNKIYTLTNIENFEFINLKCNPEKALELRERYHSVKPGYHMNKKHWNSIYGHCFFEFCQVVSTIHTIPLFNESQISHGGIPNGVSPVVRFQDRSMDRPV